MIISVDRALVVTNNSLRSISRKIFCCLCFSRCRETKQSVELCKDDAQQRKPLNIYERKMSRHKNVADQRKRSFWRQYIHTNFHHVDIVIAITVMFLVSEHGTICLAGKELAKISVCHFLNKGVAQQSLSDLSQSESRSECHDRLKRLKHFVSRRKCLRVLSSRRRHLSDVPHGLLVRVHRARSSFYLNGLSVFSQA